MAARGRVEKNNFTAGELSPWLHNRADNERYNNGVKTLRNFVILPEGGVTRRPGTRFVLPLKTESEIGLLVPFRYSGSDSYMLVINGNFVRFVTGGGFVMSGAVPYEITTSWAAADLRKLRWAQEGNTAWMVCAGYEPRKLIRGSSHTDWSFQPYLPQGGPVKIQNLDQSKTILASGTQGIVTLTASSPIFQAGHIDSVWRLDESDLSLTPNWKANEALTIATEVIPTTGANIGNMNNPANAFDGNNTTFADNTAGSGWIGKQEVPPSSIRMADILAALSVDPPTTINFHLYTKAGSAPLNELDGVLQGGLALNVGAPGPSGPAHFTITSADTATKWDYHWLRWSQPSGFVPTMRVYQFVRDRFTTGEVPILRRYNGNVYQAVNGANSGLTPPTHTEGDVLSEPGGIVWRYRHRDRGFVRITAFTDTTHVTAEVLERLPDSVAVRPTYRWWEAAWSSVDGWPEGVLLIDRGLLFWRGRDFWMTTVDDDDDFDLTALPDSAIATALRSRDGALPTIMWALDNGVIVLGCRDNEVILRAPGTFEPLTGQNIRAPVASKKGSAAHVPAALESGAIFISRSGQRLFFVAFDPDTQKLEPVEVSIASKHLLRAKAIELGWQPDPLQVLWGCCANGAMFGLTFNVEHKIAGMHSHPMINGAVEDVKSIPSSDEGVSDVYLIVRRTINGATRRYVEQLGSYFRDSGTSNAAGAWFFDCALSYSGAATGTISGLSHLALQEVGIITNNAAHARKTVSAAGVVTLNRSDVTSAVIGLVMDARVVDQPRNLNLQGTTTRGQRKRATHCFVELVETIGGTIAVNGGKPEQLELTGALPYGTAPTLFTGMKRKQMIGPLGDEAELELAASDGMPMTLIGLAPDLDVTED
jgi:hypothetical protein